MSSRSPDLPRAFLEAPLAHRGLHDLAANVVENSASAVSAAIAAGYGIEIDVQRAACGEAMVFHDDRLDRLTAATGPVAAHPARELETLTLGTGTDTIPRLSDILRLVSGRAALLIEIKDQDGALGPAVGPLEMRVAESLRGYEGPVAVMSFNPHAVAAFAACAPDNVAWGLTTCAFAAADWPEVPPARRTDLARLCALGTTGAAFLSHDRRDLESPVVTAARASGHPLLTWTIRSAIEEMQARSHADNITFEDYRPDLTHAHRIGRPPGAGWRPRDHRAALMRGH